MIRDYTLWIEQGSEIIIGETGKYVIEVVQYQLAAQGMSAGGFIGERSMAQLIDGCSNLVESQIIPLSGREYLSKKYLDASNSLIGLARDVAQDVSKYILSLDYEDVAKEHPFTINAGNVHFVSLFLLIEQTESWLSQSDLGFVKWKNEFKHMLEERVIVEGSREAVGSLEMDLRSAKEFEEYLLEVRRRMNERFEEDPLLNEVSGLGTLVSFLKLFQVAERKHQEKCKMDKWLAWLLFDKEARYWRFKTIQV